MPRVGGGNELSAASTTTTGASELSSAPAFITPTPPARTHWWQRRPTEGVRGSDAEDSHPSAAARLTPSGTAANRSKSVPVSRPRTGLTAAPTLVQQGTTHRVQLRVDTEPIAVGDESALKRLAGLLSGGGGRRDAAARQPSPHTQPGTPTAATPQHANKPSWNAVRMQANAELLMVCSAAFFEAQVGTDGMDLKFVPPQLSSCVTVDFHMATSLGRTDAQQAHPMSTGLPTPSASLAAADSPRAPAVLAPLARSIPDVNVEQTSMLEAHYAAALRTWQAEYFVGAAGSVFRSTAVVTCRHVSEANGLWFVSFRVTDHIVTLCVRPPTTLARLANVMRATSASLALPEAARSPAMRKHAESAPHVATAARSGSASVQPLDVSSEPPNPALRALSLLWLRKLQFGVSSLVASSEFLRQLSATPSLTAS
ncbi:hypothetical protein EON66_06165 [archaeon]|nr:MAG: hypothetical protein EON66_06165 [archaeon]